MDVMQSLSRLAGRLLRPLRAGHPERSDVGQAAEPAIELESPSFKSGAPIPQRHVGPNGRSPALRWSDVPVGTRELVLICEDPDAPMPKPFVHWTMYNIPPTVTSLDEGLPPSGLPLTSGAIQGKSSFGDEGYTGPAPPRGHGVHHYHFQLFALDERLDLQAPVGRDQLIEKMKGHVLATGELVGTHERD